MEKEEENREKGGSCWEGVASDQYINKLRTIKKQMLLSHLKSVNPWTMQKKKVFFFFKLGLPGKVSLLEKNGFSSTGNKIGL